MKTGSSFFLTVIAWLAFVGWLGSLWILSSMPGKSFPTVEIPFADKIVHFGLFFVGAVLFGVALRRTFTLSSWVFLLIVVAVLALIGGADEWHQVFTPNRSGADLGDWLADLAGAICGALAIGWIYARFLKRNPLEASLLAARRD